MEDTQETWVWSLGQEDPLEEKMAPHSNILAWKIPWTEEPDWLQSMGSQKSQTWLRTHARSKQHTEMVRDKVLFKYFHPSPMSYLMNHCVCDMNIYLSSISMSHLYHLYPGRNESLCWRKGALRRGGMSSCQPDRKGPLASSYLLGWPWHCPVQCFLLFESPMNSRWKFDSWFKDHTCPLGFHPVGPLYLQGLKSVTGLPADVCRKGLDV